MKIRARMKTHNLSRFFAIALVILLASTIFAYASFHDAQSILSHGMVNYHTRCVYVQNGKFYEGDGTPIRFFGVNNAELLPLYVKTYDAPTQISFQKMAQYGINFVRLAINWRCLEPNHNEWDYSYVTLIDQVMDWCQKYRIYVMLDLHIVPLGTIPRFIYPTWTIWNSTGQAEIAEAWGFLAERYANSSILMGYDLPWNEPWWRTEDISSLESYFKPSWNDWLRKRYGSLEKLDSAWKYDSQSNCYLDSEETSWGKVKMLQERGLVYQGNARNYDWQQWFGDLYNNMTEQCIQSITAHDVNHLLGVSFYVPPKQTHHTYQVHWRVPESIDFVTDHIYIDGETWADSSATALSSMVYSRSSLWQVNRSLPIIIGEFGQVTYPSDSGAQPFALASIMNSFTHTGVQGICIWCWCKYYQWSKWSIVDANYNLMTVPDMTWIPYVARAFREETGADYRPSVAIVQGITSSDGYFYLGVGEMLWQLDVPYRILSDVYVAQNASALNPYDAVIAFSKTFNITAAQNIKAWSETEGKSVLWLGGSGYYNCRFVPAWREEGCYLYYEIGLTDTETSGSGTTVNSDIKYNLVAEIDWGDWKTGENITFETGRSENWAPAKSDIDGMGGITVLKRTGTQDSVALYYVRRQAVFFSHGCTLRSWRYSKNRDDFRQIIASFLTWAQVPHLNLTEIAGITVRRYGDIIGVYEWNESSGARLVSIRGLLPGTYVLYDVSKGTLSTRTDTELASGLMVHMEANGFVIYILKASNEPAWIDSDTNARVKSALYSNERLAMTIIGGPIDVSLRIYCSNKGEPVQVTQNGDEILSWHYNESAKMLTLNFIPSPQSNVEVEWKTS